MPKNSKSIGDVAEEAASKFILANGYLILERNWRYGKLEIDIIAQNENVIAFIEVKFRKNAAYGRPEEAVNATKSKRIIEAADHYLNVKEIDLMPRFDIIAITGTSDHLDISHYHDAFRP